MKKKLFALLLTAAMCLSLAACGAKEEAPAASSAPAASTEASVEDEAPAASTEAPVEDEAPAASTEAPAEDEPSVEDETPAAPGSSGPSKPVESAPVEKPEEKPAQSAPEEQPAPEQQPAEGASVDLNAFYQSLVQTYGENFPANMNLCEMVEMLDGFYPGLSALETKQMVVYQPMMGAVVCEIALVEVASDADVEPVKGIYQARIDSQVDGGAWYPESIEGWKNNSRIVSSGNYIMMIAYSECDAVVDAFNGLFA